MGRPEGTDLMMFGDGGTEDVERLFTFLYAF
jgi:hypothetical protein